MESDLVNNKTEKEQEQKIDKPIIKKTMRLGKNIKDFNNNSIMFRICGSMQVFDYLNRKEEENENDFFENVGEVKDEVVISGI